MQWNAVLTLEGGGEIAILLLKSLQFPVTNKITLCSSESVRRDFAVDHP